MTDCNGGCHECNVTTSVAELSNGEEGLRGKVGNDVAMAGRKWKSQDIEVGFTGGVEDDARWCVNGDRGCGWAFVAHGCGRREEVCSAAQISDGEERGGGRTGNGCRH